LQSSVQLHGKDSQQPLVEVTEMRREAAGRGQMNCVTALQLGPI